eukprot:6604505-Pyramimonas_sp.AAC.1
MRPAGFAAGDGSRRRSTREVPLRRDRPHVAPAAREVDGGPLCSAIGTRSRPPPSRHTSPLSPL